MLEEIINEIQQKEKVHEATGIIWVSALFVINRSSKLTQCAKLYL